MASENKKVVPLLLIAGVVAAVGVFQFKGGSPEPEPASKPKSTTKASPSADETTKEAAMPPLPPRDPFEKQALPIDPSVAKPTVALTPPSATFKPTLPPTGGSRRGGSSNPGVPLGPLEPLPPLGVPMTNPTQAPVPVASAPSKPVPAPDPLPSFKINGIVEGAKPVALISDGHGGQRLARVNETIDGEFKIKAISRQGVVVARGSKTYTLKLGGTTGDKK